jgi:acetyl esterase/lipase
MVAFLEKLGENLPHPDKEEVKPPIGFPSLEEARLWAEEDGRQAIRFLRQHATALDIDPNRIGIMGFSAGGGIAINAVLEHDSLSCPNFAAGIYPGYRKVSRVPDDAPPVFIAIADDDELVAPISSARLYEDWHIAGKSVELHIFANGGHGFGMHKQHLLSDPWTELFKHWMASHGYISLAKQDM